MNDYTGPELEGEEVALLDVLRNAEGPSPTQEDRMLARLRAQIEIEAEVRGNSAAPRDDDASPAASEPKTNRAWRTGTVGLLAFAAGVALTWGLRSDAPAPAGASHDDARDDVVVRHDDPRATQHPAALVESAAPNRGTPRLHPSPPSPGQTGDSGLPLSPPSLVDVVEEETPSTATHLAEQSHDSEGNPAEQPAPDPSRDGASATERSEAEGRSPYKDESPSDGRPGPGPSSTGRGTSPAPPTPPTGPLAPTSPAVGPVELVGGAPSAMGRPYVPSVGGGGPAPSAPSAGPRDTPGPAPDRPGPEPDRPADHPPDEGPPEPPDAEDPEPLEPEDACGDALMMCIESAELMCGYDPENCERLFEFCDFSMEVCLAGGEPPPEYLPDSHDEPPPDENPCTEQFEMCMSEWEATCGNGGETPPDECMDFEWQCLDEQALCEGYDPPPPPSEW